MARSNAALLSLLCIISEIFSFDFLVCLVHPGCSKENSLYCLLWEGVVLTGPFALFLKGFSALLEAQGIEGKKPYLEEF